MPLTKQRVLAVGLSFTETAKAASALYDEDYEVDPIPAAQAALELAIREPQASAPQSATSTGA